MTFNSLTLRSRLLNRCVRFNNHEEGNQAVVIIETMLSNRLDPFRNEAVFSRKLSATNAALSNQGAVN
jgi:hypothetical protein